MSLLTATDTELQAWDVSGPAPEKATTYPLSFRGRLVGFLDGDEPAFVEIAPRTTVSGQVFDVTLRRVWSKTRGAADLKVATLDEQPRSLALSPDGNRLATMAYRWDAVRVFDVKTAGGIAVLRIPAVANRTNMILPHALVYSPDSKTLIGIGANDYPVLRRSNGAVVAWDIATGAVKWEADEGEPAPGLGILRRRPAFRDRGHGDGRQVQVRDAESGDVILRQAVADRRAVSPCRRTGRRSSIGHRGPAGTRNRV